MASFNINSQIPTSIGGVSIPGGIGGLAQGPLASLFGSAKGSGTILNYPSNLGDSVIHHYVKFTMRQVIPADYATQGGQNTNVTTNTGETLATTGTTGTILPSLQAATSYAQNKLGVQNLQAQTKKTDKVIQLYMPDSINMAYDNSYDAVSVQSLIGKYLAAGGTWEELSKNYNNSNRNTILGKTSDSAFKTSTSKNALALATALSKNSEFGKYSDILLKGAGYSINPMLQMVYKGIGIRSFQLEFTFTPRTKTEAQNVKNIIDTFKFHSLPQIDTGSFSGGMFLIPPSIFNVSFISKKAGGVSGLASALAGGSNVGSAIGSFIDGVKTVGGSDGINSDENLFLYKVGDCVLKNVQIDFAPNGWVAHADGAPVQTKLTLQFSEMEIIDRTRFTNNEVR
jgi:hypothetical protein